MNTTSAPSVSITAIAFVGYPVTNVARARAFYENLLGLKPTMTFEDQGVSWIEYDIGANTLAITNLPGGQWVPSTSGPNLAFEVADFDSTIAALRAAGTRFTVEPTDSPVCRIAVACDPDGNSVAFHHRKAG